MRPEKQLLDLFADLEQQAEALALAERDAEVAELARAEYAEVTLADRLHASVGHRVELSVSGVGPVRGEVAAAGRGWCVVTVGSEEQWVVLTPAVLGAHGLAPGARRPAARPVTARLGVGSFLRRLEEARQPVVVVRTDGVHRAGRVLRVGADFFELVTDERPDGPAYPASPGAGVVEVVPLAAVAALRAR